MYHMSIQHNEIYIYIYIYMFIFIFKDGKLAGLEEFRMQKDDLMAKFAMMKNELEEMEQHHKQSIYELEKKQIIDKDR